MAYNGSGTFVRLYSWQTDRDANVKIRADKMDAEMDGMAVGLSTAITKDGQTTPTANLPLGGFRFTGAGAGVAATDLSTIGQLQSSAPLWAGTDTGAADAYVFALTPVLTTYAAGQRFTGIIGTSHTNTGATATVNFGGGVKTVAMPDRLSAPPAGAISAGSICTFLYDGTFFILVSPPVGAFAGVARVTSDFSVTSNATLANVTGLTATLQAGVTYKFRAVLFMTCGATGGIRFGIGGTATITDLRAVGGYANNGGNVALTTTITAFGQLATTASGDTLYNGTVDGTITANAAGTITVTFAQNTSNGTASLMKRGSTLEVQLVA